MAARGVDDRLVYRPGFSRLLLVTAAAIGVWWVTDAALHGQLTDALLVGLWLLAVTSALACLLWRPAVLVDDDGVELRNVLRDVRVPWSALTGIETRYTLTLLVGEHRFQSWAGAAPGRPTPTRRLIGGTLGAAVGEPSRHDHDLPDPRWTPGSGDAVASSRDLRADSGATAFMIEQRWQAWRNSAPRPSGGATANPADDQPGGPSSGPAKGGGEAGDPDGVLVRWQPALPAVAGVATVAAMIATWLLR